MKLISKYILFFILLPVFSLSQTTDTIGKVKYTKDFVFNDGIYRTFQEFKDDNPSITNFSVRTPSLNSNPNFKLIEITKIDSIKNIDNSVFKNMWGYSYHGEVYITHNCYSYYYKFIIIGALSFFVGVSGSLIPANDVMVGYGADNKYEKFMLDFETGDVKIFNYKNFSAFLKAHDEELYNELMKQKKKKKIISKYLLKYNQRHPIWFKES